MKSFLLMLGMIFISSSAFAVEPTVQLTSYVYVNQERKVAEICGYVNQVTKTPTFVQVTVDYNSRKPAPYNTFVGRDGRFCMVVVTYYGTAIAHAF